MAIPFRLKKQRVEDGNIFGKLGAVALTDLLHMLGVNQRTATVSLSRNGKSGEIFFRQGVLLHASAGSARGDEALMRLVDWTDADFVVEEGIPAETPSTISKSVDAVLLDVMTRLDEGFVPNVTPFPGLDKPTVEEIESAARISRLKPPPPRRRLRFRKALGAAGVVALGLASYLAYASSRIGGVPAAVLPAVESGASHANDPAGIAAEALDASIARRALDSWSLLEARGVTREEPSAIAGQGRATETAEPSRAAVVSETGYILVMAVPWAEVAIDGRKVGETPLAELALSVGPHELVLSNPNVIGLIRDRVEARAGETIRRSYSFGVTGRIRVIVKPWADVYVDGRLIGQTPMDELQVTEGSHEVVLRHPTLGERTRTVEVRRDETAVVEVEM